MCEVISLAQYKKEKELKAKRKLAVNNLARISDKEEFNYQFLKILDLFIKKNYPDAFWRFDLFL